MTPETPKSANQPWTLSIEPKRWQSAAFERWTKHQRGIVEAVTGAGKTLFAEMCISWFHKHAPDARILVIVPTVALADQWYVSLSEDLNLPQSELAMYCGGSHPDRPRAVNVMVLNTARTRAANIASGARTMLVVDECHRAASKSNARALEGEFAATLGISATPRRQNDDLFETVLIPKLGPLIFRYPYNDAIRDGALVPFDLVNVRTTFTPYEQTRFDQANAAVARAYALFERGDVTSEQLKFRLLQRARISANAVNRIAVAVRLASEKTRQRTIVFHESIAAAEKISSLLMSQGLNATTYHSRVPQTIGRDNLRMFRRGMFDVLVTCRALDEGLNVPETSVAVIASSTSSMRQRVQRLGRVLRPSLGKSFATIYTIYLSDLEEQRLSEEANSLEGVANVQWIRSRVMVRGQAHEGR